MSKTLEQNLFLTGIFKDGIKIIAFVLNCH